MHTTMYSDEHYRQARIFTVWSGPEDLLRLVGNWEWRLNADQRNELKRVNALVERLREFVRFNCLSPGKHRKKRRFS
jgi:hypothetical protein